LRRISVHSKKSVMAMIATLLGLAAALGGTAWAASNERILYSFSGGADGDQPMSELVFDAHGNLFGTTHDGGEFGDGTVFELTPAANGLWSEWKETVIHSFHQDGKDGAHPSARVIFDKEGNLWGTTENGGTDRTGTPVIIGGTVFELSPGPNETWSETVFSFQHANIHSGLIFDKAGNIYGTTMSDPRMPSGGTVFKLARASNGKYSPTTLYAFRQTRVQFMQNTPFVDGIMPLAGVIFDAEGNLYGITSAEGAGTTSNGGTFFKLARGSSGTWAETPLHNFNFNAGDAAAVSTDLIMDSHGNLYGTAGGGAYRLGTLFELTRGSNGKWSEAILHNFYNSNGEGYAPHCRLIFDKAGNLYGTTGGGGTFGLGTVFKLSPGPNGAWVETVLHAFVRDGTEGSAPSAGLIFDAQGNLYGTTSRGGGDPGNPGHGTVFEILAETGPAVSSEVQPVPVPAPAAPTPVSPGPSSPAAPSGSDPLAAVWQSDAFAGQTFRFKLDGNTIYAYGSQQEPLGKLEAKEKKGAVDLYQGQVQIGPLTLCPGGRGLMQIKAWNDSRLDAKIETPVNGAGGTTCGGVMGMGRLIPWQRVTFVKK
jgi:uncharacterized repeat protein (TIGR03803 family)